MFLNSINWDVISIFICDGARVQLVHTNNKKVSQSNLSPKK